MKKTFLIAGLNLLSLVSFGNIDSTATKSSISPEDLFIRNAILFIGTFIFLAVLFIVFRYKKR